MINATVNMLSEWLHQDKKILMLSSLVVLNTFENKKGIVKKILVIILALILIRWICSFMQIIIITND